MAKYKMVLKDTKNVKDSKKEIKDYYGDGELEMERDGEQDDQYVIIEGSRDGYGISQVEEGTMTVGELIDYLSQFDSNTKVVIGNDFRAGSYYTYGSINGDSIASVTITEPEEYDEEEDEEDEHRVEDSDTEVADLIDKFKKYLKSIWKSSDATIKENYYFYLQDINSSKLKNEKYFPRSLEEILNDEDYLKDCIEYYIENEPEFIKEYLK